MSTLPIAMTRAVRADRLRDIGVAGALVMWLAYTRIYWVIQAAHVGLPPCPFCGGTRSFAYMWQGDIADAVWLYPLGPALFVGTVVGIGGLAGGAISGRTWTPRLNPMQWRVVGIGVASAILVSWALKVFVLGN